VNVNAREETGWWELIQALIEQDNGLRKILGDQEMRTLGRGNSSVTYSLGKGKVIKVSRSDMDCEMAERVMDLGSSPRGWTRVDEVIHLAHGRKGDPSCIIVAERVKLPSEFCDKTRHLLDNVIGTIDLHHILWHHQVERMPHGRPPPDDEIKKGLRDFTKRQVQWYRDLVAGLKAVGRWEDETKIDTYDMNYGLNRKGKAVWLDFGV
jgi:hypothetical protein